MPGLVPLSRLLFPFSHLEEGRPGKGREPRKGLSEWRHEGCSPSRVRACMRALVSYSLLSLPSLRAVYLSGSVSGWLCCAVLFVYLSICPVCATRIHPSVHPFIHSSRIRHHPPPSLSPCTLPSLRLCRRNMPALHRQHTLLPP